MDPLTCSAAASWTQRRTWLNEGNIEPKNDRVAPLTERLLEYPVLVELASFAFVCVNLNPGEISDHAILSALGVVNGYNHVKPCPSLPHRQDVQQTGGIIAPGRVLSKCAALKCQVVLSLYWNVG